MELYTLFSFMRLSVLFHSYVEANAVTFDPLSCGNPSNSKRGCDTMYGCGYYGASCGDWTHECLDIVCAVGATVLTPFDVMLNQKAAPYINQPKKEPINNGTTLSGEGLCFKLFYVKMGRYSGTTLKKG